MAKSNAVAGKGNKKTKALFVFDVIFIILALIAVVVAVLLFTPLQKTLPTPPSSIGDALYNWVYYHVLKPFDRGIRPNLDGYPSKPFTAAFFLWLIYLAGVLFLYLLYQPFVIRANNKAKGKTQVYRKVIGWITFAVLLICGLALFSLLYRERREKMFGAAYSWFNVLVDRIANSFKAGKLSPLKLSLISKNGYFNALAYAIFACVFFEIVRLLICGLGKPKKVEEEKKAEVPVSSEPVPTVEETKEEDIDTENESVPYLPPKETIIAEEAKKETQSEKIEPTYHDINLLTRLECIHPEPIKDLPGLFETDIEKLKGELSGEGIYPIVDVQGKALLEKLDTVSIQVAVLPGIDEWNADPFKEEKTYEELKEDKIEVDSSMFETIKPVEDDIVIEEPKEETIAQQPVEKAKEAVEEAASAPVETVRQEITDLTQSAAPAPRTEVQVTEASAAEAKPEPEPEPLVEEKEEGPIILAINDGLSDGKRSQEEDHDKVVSENLESRYEKKTTVRDNQHETLTTEPVTFDSTWILPAYVPPKKPEGPVTICINHMEKDGKRPQEEDHEKTVLQPSASRIDAKEVTKDNSHRPITTQTADIDNSWILPPYVPPKPTSNVKKIDLAPISKPNGRNKPSAPKPITPIKPVAPAPAPVQEEPKKEEEKKVIAPLAGPLHSTAKSKHEKIEAVKARKVAFTLQNYQLKTYKGSLTPEQAFARGVTKVQPTARPVFANQTTESAWKQKRREEEIRKNGYSDVTKVDKLNGKVEPVSAPIAPSGSSIRELRNSRKAEKAKAQEESKTEEAKPSPIKPIAPIKPITPVAPVNASSSKGEPKKEENTHPTTASFFHPIAPISHKPTKRPEIKPVDPLSKKK